MINLVELFCHVDDFCQHFMPMYEKTLLEQRVKYRKPRQCSLSYSEIITIILYFYQSKHRHFKHYYLNYVCTHLKQDFPRLVSYNRFIELKNRVVIPMCAYLQSTFSPSGEINFVDSTLGCCSTPVLKFVIIVGLHDIKLSKILLNVEKPLLIGSMVSNYISLLMMKVN